MNFMMRKGCGAVGGFVVMEIEFPFKNSWFGAQEMIQLVIINLYGHGLS